jgi:hypothetical protein
VFHSNQGSKLLIELNIHDAACFPEIQGGKKEKELDLWHIYIYIDAYLHVREILNLKPNRLKGHQNV